MGEIKCRINIHGNVREYVPETTYKQLAKEYQKQFPDNIVLVLVNNRLRELREKAESGNLTFITTADKDGRKAYRRSTALLMQKAVHNLYGEEKITVRIMHSIAQGYYCELKRNEEKNGASEQAEWVAVDEQMLRDLKQEMQRLVEADFPIEKHSLPTADAVELFRRLGMTDKERLFRYRRSSRVNIYELDHYKDYFYGYMVPSTGYLKYFDLTLYKEGFMLLFPGKDTRTVDIFVPSDKLYLTLEEASEWGHTMGVGTIGALNDAVSAGRIQEIILIQEALMEQKIGQLAEQIKEGHHKKFIMIAGPSSSGKTTFSHRLSIQLAAHGMKPHPVPLDDFYVDRDKTPKDADGKLDFECLEALDIDRFNNDMTSLLNGDPTELPVFNFKTGKREEKGRMMQLGEEDVLVIEGIHGLNDRLSYSLPQKSKFRIYISALTQLDIDEHNCLPTTDGRLIRRIVRDARTRATSARETIAMWDSVRRGEEKNIFPFQEGADVMFNSALIYELAVLKQYAEPLLFAIERDCPEYLEAKRLLKFLDYFLPVPADNINNNSIIREFIGGSCFNV